MAKTSTGGRLKAAVFLLVSLFAAALAALVIFTVIRNLQAQIAELDQPLQMESVVVTKRTLWPGETITPEDLEVREYPPDFIPQNVLTTAELALTRVPRERILEGEFIRPERLADQDAGQGLPAIVPRGMRAISLNISGGSAVAGFLNPGNYVDLLVTAGDPVQTKTLFQAVTVLAVNDRLGAKIELDEDGNRKGEQKVASAPSVTVAVTPEQAEQVTHAHIQGVVVLTLRNDIDVTHRETNEGTMIGTLLTKTDEEGNDAPEGTVKRVKVGTYGKAISIAEYNQRKNNDGTLIIIEGDTKTVEKGLSD